MSVVMQINPFDFFVDLDGNALDSGYVWIGEINKDPRQYPAQAYYDQALTVPAAMPLRTSGGYIVRNGSPTFLYISGNYSIMVLDKNLRQIFYVPDFLMVGNSQAATIADIQGIYSGLANTTDPAKGVSLIPTASRLVPNIATLRTLPKSGASVAVNVQGYYAIGDGGGGNYYLDAVDVTTADNGGTVIVANDGGRWKMQNIRTITTKQFGAKADGSTDDFASLNKWFDFGINNKCEMIISNGVHKVGTKISWDFTPVATVGVTMRGESSLVNCRLDFSSVTGDKPFQIIAAGSTALFYIRLNFSITTNYDGVGFTVGKDDFSDAWNECSFDLWVNNSSQGANAVTMLMNHVLHSDIRLVCNGGGSGRPGQAFYPGVGTALILRQAIMNNFMLALGNANKGLYITAGFTYNNVFSAMDIEEINYGILIDTQSATRNNFLGGTYLAYNVLNFTNGVANVMVNCGLQAYLGGVIKVATTGLTIISPQNYDISTPGMPASGVAVTNTTGRAIMLSIAGGTVSVIAIAQFGAGTQNIPIGAWSRADIMLLAGEAITLTYTVTPAWVWRPAE